MRKLNKSIIKNLKNGDKEAFNIVFLEYKDITYYLCYNYLKNYDDSNDCVQEIFLRLLNKIQLYNEKESSFYTWFVSLSRNYILNFIKSKNCRMNRITLNEDCVEKATVENNTEINLMLEDIECLLGEIKYSIFVNKVGFNMTFKEIGTMLDMHPEKVRRLYHEANKTVNEYLKEKEN